MKFALFLGCTIPARLQQYELSSRAILDKLGVEPVDIKEFNCCGYPLRNIDFKASVLSAARNMALAEKEGLDMIVLCKCGFGMLKKASSLMKEDPSLKDHVNGILEKEDLNYKGDTQIKHLLSVLYHDVGLDSIREKVTRPYEGLKIAAHYGCHALRPSEVTEFDDPVNPTLFEQLVEVTGAESIDWQARLDCCGAPQFGINDDLSMDLMEKKIAGAKEAGADYICDACSYCHVQFDTVQGIMNKERGNSSTLPPILYSQLLGLSLGIDGESLGIGLNRMDIASVEKFLST